MKKRSFLMAAFAAMFMASCSDNDLNQVDDSFIVNGNYKAYMKVAISNPPSVGSRALDNNDDGTPKFEDGSKEENAIDEILFVFYNINENYVTYSRLKKGYDSSKDEDFVGGIGDVNQTPTGNVEATLEINVPVSSNADSYVPYYVVAYINPTADGVKLNKTANLSEVRKLYRNSWLQNPEDKTKEPRFLMNNSSYYSGTGDAKSVFVTEVGKLYANPDDLEGKDPINIYVERLAAKVTVSLKEDTKIDDEKTGIANNYTLKFNPIGWKLNATAKQTDLVKDFLNKTYTEVNTELAKPYKDLWNFSGLHRSYWCTSKYFNHEDYPETTSDVGTGDQTNGKYPLRYFSYNEIKGSDENEGLANKFGGTEYCLEHTIGAKALGLPTKQAAITSVIVTGTYTLIDGDGNEITTEKTFYRRGKTNDKWNIYLKDALIAEMAKEQQSVYVKQEGTEDKYELLKSGELLAGIFDIYRPTSAAVLENSVLPGRYVCLQITKEKITPDTYYTYDVEEGTYAPITVGTDDLNKDLKIACGTAEKYEQGMAYFNIPIAHFGNPSNTNEQVGVGYYGVVRNHAYKIVINGIDGMGTGIGDPGNPIVPPTETQTYYISTKINVLSWRIASQEVSLGK